MKKKNKVIAVTNLKGGIGKTTISFNLLHEIIELYEYGVLDLERDMDESEGQIRIAGLDMDANQNSLIQSMYEHDWDGKSVFRKSYFKNKLISECYATIHFNKSIDFKSDNIGKYKYVVIDTPPSLVLAESKLRNFVTDIVIPLNEKYSQQGLATMKVLIDNLPIGTNVFVVKYNCAKDSSFDANMLESIEMFLEYAIRKRKSYTNINKAKIYHHEAFISAENMGLPIILSPSARRIKPIKEFAYFLDKVIQYGD